MGGMTQQEGAVTESSRRADEEGKLTRAKKKQMSDDDLLLYFHGSLSSHNDCGNKLCNCLDIVKNVVLCRAIARYLVWFERKSK